jgi:hypothetical protein
MEMTAFQARHNKFDTSGKSPAYLHHRKNSKARAGKSAAGFFNLPVIRFPAMLFRPDPKGRDPRSRDSGFDAAHHPEMTGLCIHSSQIENPAYVENVHV